MHGYTRPVQWSDTEFADGRAHKHLSRFGWCRSQRTCRSWASHKHNPTTTKGPRARVASVDNGSTDNGSFVATTFGRSLLRLSACRIGTLQQDDDDGHVVHQDAPLIGVYRPQHRRGYQNLRTVKRRAVLCAKNTHTIAMTETDVDRDPWETVRAIQNQSRIDDDGTRMEPIQKIEYNKIFATVRLSQIGGDVHRLFQEPWEARLLVLKTKMSETCTGRMPRTRVNRSKSKRSRKPADDSEDDWLKEI